MPNETMSRICFVVKRNLNRNSTGKVTVTLDEHSTWTLTGDSYISAFEGDLSHVVMGGYQLYIDGAAI